MNAAPALLDADLSARARFRATGPLRELGERLALATADQVQRRHQQTQSWAPIGAGVLCTPPGPTRLRMDAKGPEGGDAGGYLLAVLSRQGKWVELHVRAPSPAWIPGGTAPRALGQAAIALLSAALEDAPEFTEVQWQLGEGWQYHSVPARWDQD